MRTLILVAVLGSIVTLISCKSVARDPEPESQPELFGAVPVFVKKFLKVANRGPMHSTSRVYLSEALEWATKHGDYYIFKKVIDSADNNNLLRYGNSSEAIIFALKSPDADKKISYLIERGANIEKAMAIAFHQDMLHEVPDIVRAGGSPNKGMIYAIERGELNIMKQLVKLGANNFNAVLKRAAYKGDVVAVKYMLEKGATNIEEVLDRVSDVIKRIERIPQLAENREKWIQVQKILAEALNNTP